MSKQFNTFRGFFTCIIIFLFKGCMNIKKKDEGLYYINSVQLHVCTCFLLKILNFLICGTLHTISIIERKSLLCKVKY